MTIPQVGKLLQSLRRDLVPRLHVKRSEASAAIQNYIAENAASWAKRLKADSVKDSRSLIRSMDGYEKVTDEYKGVKITWSSNRSTIHCLEQYDSCRCCRKLDAKV
ncbi:hypothetical protein ACJRO7_035415 [Eucalyptus globulus]|uniref:AAA-type ATPase N-terminal domain-containing protein n=1 Tax=Eucalyptus globulus TaxID=34317 RepID=A0ABD3J8U1_EUCGL